MLEHLVGPALWAIAAVLATLLLIYSVEIACGLIPGRHRECTRTIAGRAAILIPAHNEELGIAKTLLALRKVIPAETLVLVVADNCTDQTANVARAGGALVVERFDSNQRGKGFALDFGRTALAADPPDVVIVLDADCRLLAGSVTALTSAAMSGRPGQAINLISPDVSAAPLVQISSFAFLVKNLVRARGLARLGDCALLSGTGMAFRWSLFADLPLASGEIAEDLGLSISLIRKGIRPYLVEAAGVRSAPASQTDSLTQRRRWEHGFLDLAKRHAAPLLLAALRDRSRALLAVALHLLVPPLALLMIVSLTTLGVSLAFAFWGQYWGPPSALGLALAVALVLTASAWIIHGRSTVHLLALVQAPLYVLWKIPLYLGFFRKPETLWQRTRRPGED